MGGSGPVIDKLDLAAQAVALPSPALAKMRLTFRQGGPSDGLGDSKADRARMVKTRPWTTIHNNANARSNQLCPIFVGRLKHFFVGRLKHPKLEPWTLYLLFLPQSESDSKSMSDSVRFSGRLKHPKPWTSGDSSTLNPGLCISCSFLNLSPIPSRCLSWCASA